MASFDSSTRTTTRTWNICGGWLGKSIFASQTITTTTFALQWNRAMCSSTKSPFYIPLQRLHCWKRQRRVKTHWSNGLCRRRTMTLTTKNKKTIRHLHPEILMELCCGWNPWPLPMNCWNMRSAYFMVIGYWKSEQSRVWLVWCQRAEVHNASWQQIMDQCRCTFSPARQLNYIPCAPLLQLNHEHINNSLTPRLHTCS